MHAYSGKSKMKNSYIDSYSYYINACVLESKHFLFHVSIYRNMYYMHASMDKLATCTQQFIAINAAIWLPSYSIAAAIGSCMLHILAA